MNIYIVIYIYISIYIYIYKVMWLQLFVMRLGQGILDKFNGNLARHARFNVSLTVATCFHCIRASSSLEKPTMMHWTSPCMACLRSDCLSSTWVFCLHFSENSCKHQMLQVVLPLKKKAGFVLMFRCGSFQAQGGYGM